MINTARKPGLVGRLIRAAGRACGRGRGRGGAAGERGTVLLMVIGVLAMMSIVAVVYVTIGQSDRRNAAAIVRESRVDDQVRTVREYLARVIAMDLFSYREGPAGVYWREFVDRPSIDQYAVSDLGAAIGPEPWVQFDPVGRGTGTDPWLSAPEPWYIPHVSGPVVGRTGFAPQDSSDDYEYRVDWPHISNLAPTGQFVNKFALRLKGFDATAEDLRDNLTLFDGNGRPQAPGSNQIRPNGEQAQWWIPEHWTRDQIWMHRPMFELDRSNNAFGPGDARFLPYQYADADGDGMIDSRWWALTNLSDITGQTQFFPAAPAAGPMRIFVATRAIDLSGLVNLNTARDFRLAPNAANVAGLVPSEIDLLRLLTLNDAYFQYPEVYDGYVQPSGGVYKGDYSAGLAGRRFAQNHGNVGGSAYAALRTAFGDGLLVPGVDGTDPAQFHMTSLARRREHYQHFGLDPAGASSAGGTVMRFGTPFAMADEAELRTFHGANDPGRLSRLEAIMGGRDANTRQSNQAALTSPYCPLRSNRPLDVERGQRADYATTPIDGLASPEALLQSATDIRRLLTVHNGMRFFRPRPANSPPADLTAQDLRLDADALLQLALRQNDPEPEHLFYAYARALMPYSYVDSTDLWGSTGLSGNSGWGQGMREQSTLFYGHRGAEFALRCAAHMTANAMSMAANRQTGAVLTNDLPALVIPFIRRPPGTPRPNLPQDHLWVDLAEDPAASEHVLAVSNADASGDGIIVYPMDVQPFITEAATFLMFTDAPVGLGGDDDGQNISGDPNLPQYGPITINGDISPGNSDFVMQVFAVQVHNPFQYPIRLSDYYFDFGQMRFTYDGVETLGTGQTQVLYSTNPGSSMIQSRWTALNPIGTASFQSWLSSQFQIQDASGVREPLEMSRSARSSTGITPIDPFEVVDMLASAGSVQEPENRRVVMWRKFGEPGLTDDDILADRLRDPADSTSRATLDRRFSLPDDEVSGTESGPEGQNHNTGFTIVLTGQICRPRDPSGANGSGPYADIPLGAIPAYCIERKGDGASPSLNQERTEPVNDPDSLDRANFQSPYGGDTFASVVAAQSGQTSTALTSLNDEPKDKVWGAPLGNNRMNKGYEEVYPEIHFRGNRFRAGTAPNDYSTLRIGDMVLPMIVGPSQLQQPGGTPEDHERDWTTMSEALAIATGFDYDNVSADRRFTSDPMNPYHALAEYAGDRGHVRLDTFVPCVYDQTRPGALPLLANYAVPPNPQSQEVLYPQLPIAMNIFDTFRPPNYGNERKLVPGVININTAPLAVLRLLPLFTPEWPPRPNDPAGPNNGWLTLPDTGRTANNQQQALLGVGAHYDIAAMAVAYRDKTQAYSRPVNASVPNTNPIDFTDANAATGLGRGETNWIHGTREETGFAQVGELMAVMKRDPPTNYHDRPGYTSNQSDLDNSITRLGFGNSPNETSNAQRGLESFEYRDPITTEVGLDQIVNDFDEQLTIANAVVNMVNVRSDVFCVWFVIHGYLPSDVEGLDDNEPMVPSLARRYVMVVDRSNVTKLGERPQILLFQEVPY